MNVVAWIFGAVLCLVFAGAAGSKLIDRGDDRIKFGYTLRQWRGLGLVQLAGVAGTLIGLIWSSYEFVAIAAAVGFAAMMLGALMAHARVEDEGKEAIPAAVMMVLSVLFIIFISLR